MKNKLNSFLRTAGLVTFAAISLSACVIVTVNGGSSGGSTYVDPYQHAWYDVYGNECTANGYPMSGCNFYADGSKITASGDPYYSSLTLYYDTWSYTDSYGYGRNYTGYAWLSQDGVLYDSNGNALNELDSDSTETADVLSQASQAESAMAVQVGQAFAQKYALAEDQGITIAKTLQSWAVLGRDRSRTSADVAAFSKRLYGVSIDSATAAMTSAMKGDESALNDLNVDVAAHWGTSPETSKQILKSWYADDLSQLGVQ